MTAKQTAFYWMQWGKVTRHARATPEPQGVQGVPKELASEMLESIRKASNLEATGGRSDSHADFSNAELTLFCGICARLRGDEAASVAAAAQAAGEAKRGNQKWVALVRAALRLLGKTDGYALAILRNRRLVHIGSLTDLTRDEALVVISPLGKQLAREGKAEQWAAAKGGILAQQSGKAGV